MDRLNRIKIQIFSKNFFLDNGRIAFDFKSIGKSTDSFIPLSLEVDSNGNVYTANYRNSVFIINPR